jgi:hypothetical protein
MEMIVRRDSRNGWGQHALPFQFNAEQAAKKYEDKQLGDTAFRFGVFPKMMQHVEQMG